MDALKLRRTPLRTAFTKAVNHLQEIIENDPLDMNAVETAFEQLKVKSAKLKEVEDAVLELMIESNCTQEAYNIEFEAIEGYAEKMIAWQVRVKNIMKTDALGQKGNHSVVTSSSSSLRLPKIQFQQFSGESDAKCIICSKLPLRSGLETESASVENSTIASSSSSNVLTNQACTSEVLLQTLVIVLQNGNHKSLVRALIDTGSQKSYILKSTAENLGFKYEGEEEFIHSLFGGSKTKMYRHKCYKICLTDIDNYYTCNLNVSDQEIICNDVPSIRHGPWTNELKNKKNNLSDSGHNFGGKIEILLGADIAGKLYLLY
ncbi:uncharacterized protein TNIN_278181 [Trichonephila inaurata madagascariensis]|uniref:Peptidase aspartic putative domain-containing protein n=1 Tax=Trichonephila inaurata madagascariensis TaxID=2747483 RepID=A0A8X6MHF4_9ARAC|nr:uncharacterized protein TNIN_278181 [Trichonephila inaurata madagascariensis]